MGTVIQVDFGRDTSVTTGRRSGRLVSGPRLVGEAIFRRLSTPRGRLRGGKDEANYGIDLTTKIGSLSSKAQEAALPGQIRLECLKDPRLLDVDVTVLVTRAGPVTTIDVAIIGRTALGPFDLRLRVDEVTVAMVGLEAA